MSPISIELIIQISIGLSASLILLFAFLPQTLLTIKTKNTAALTISMFIICFIARLCFSLSAILTIIVYIHNQDYGLSLYALTLSVLICHGINMLLNLIIAFIKINNVYKAKIHKMNENEYIIFAYAQKLKEKVSIKNK